MLPSSSFSSSYVTPRNPGAAAQGTGQLLVLNSLSSLVIVFLNSLSLEAFFFFPLHKILYILPFCLIFPVHKSGGRPKATSPIWVERTSKKYGLFPGLLGNIVTASEVCLVMELHFLAGLAQR
jgi:hypothetical protein